jgi:hypothetical protein
MSSPGAPVEIVWYDPASAGLNVAPRTRHSNNGWRMSIATMETITRPRSAPSNLGPSGISVGTKHGSAVETSDIVRLLQQAGSKTEQPMSRSGRRQEVMRLVIAVLFWVGLFWTVREWRYAKKHGLAIARTEKLYLAMTFPLIFVAQLALDVMGVAPEVAITGSGLAIGVALNGWALKRRIQRASSK